jgi:sugar lactone lactonase YvrE
MAVKLRLEADDQQALQDAINDLKVMSKGRIVIGKPRQGRNGHKSLWRAYGDIIPPNERKPAPFDNSDLPF